MSEPDLCLLAVPAPSLQTYGSVFGAVATLELGCRSLWPSLPPLTPTMALGKPLETGAARERVVDGLGLVYDRNQ